MSEVLGRSVGYAIFKIARQYSSPYVLDVSFQVRDAIAIKARPFQTAEVKELITDQLKDE